ncbi:MAG: UPF0489 family protein [Pseudomonadota bacterium]
MDNHRAALWCWLQELPKFDTVGLLHIDEHTDTLLSRLKEWDEVLPPLDNLSIDEYLGHEFDSGLGHTPTIQWDNYLSLFLNRYNDRLNKAIFATHGVGDKPIFNNLYNASSWDLPKSIAYWIENDAEQWIINIDLDYFFCNDASGGAVRLFSDEYIEKVFDAIRRCYDAGHVACLTICLTPDEGYTGGWEPAEKLCSRVCEILGIQFSLPTA